jgi:putative ABC transport system permease protein
MKTGQLLSLAWRESRFARKRLFLFLSAISLGVAALVAVQGFAANMQAEVRNQARAMLGADVSLSSREPFGERTEELLDSVGAAGPDVVRVTSFASMALHPGTGATRLVQVRAPEPGFPYYGTIETQPAGQWETLHDGRNLVVDPALLIALGAEIGDSVAIGATRFRITGALERMPGDVEVASSSPPPRCWRRSFSVTARASTTRRISASLTRGRPTPSCAITGTRSGGRSGSGRGPSRTSRR